jgi:itaconate CoA-transferase
MFTGFRFYQIGFEVFNTLPDLGFHPHLGRCEVGTPNGVVSYPAPAAISVGDPRHYGAVPGIGECPDTSKDRT